MKFPTASVADRLHGAAERVAAVFAREDLATVVEALDDGALLRVMTDAATARDAADVVLAATAAEVKHRSARELGYTGLAQRKGHRDATALVQNITGQSRAEVNRALLAGEELVAAGDSPNRGGMDAEASTIEPPATRWLRVLREALASGRVSQAQFHAIRTGIGEPPVERYPDLDPGILPEAWATAIGRLLDEAATLPVEDLRAAARIARDRFDPVGVALRFDERFQARSFRMWTDERGQRHGRIVFDDDAGAWADAIMNSALRPRRGPRFAESGATARAKDNRDDGRGQGDGQASENPASDGREQPGVDDRSNEQLQYDTLLAILRTGANADPQSAFGDRQPGVRIVVESAAVDPADERGMRRVIGVGHLEDGGASLPGGVIEKYLCDAGSVTVGLDAFRRPLDVGRDQRLFTRKQRIAIVVRDGGCMWPSCTAPPAHCELHHINHWCKDHGRTDVDDGVPLCRNCHLRLHNQGWHIRRERDPVSGFDAYWLHPPPNAVTEETGTPVRLESKSPRRFLASRRTQHDAA